VESPPPANPRGQAAGIRPGGTSLREVLGNWRGVPKGIDSSHPGFRPAGAADAASKNAFLHFCRTLRVLIPLKKQLPNTSLREVLGNWRPQGDSNPCYRRERAVS
jgi:hypothetical protein